MNTWSKYFVNGLVIVVPIAITVTVVLKLYQVAEWLLGAYLPDPVHYPGVSLLIILAAILLVGWSSSNWILQRLLRLWEQLLGAVPVVRVVYNSVKQLSTVVLDSPQLMKQPALVPYPHPGAKAIGFVMSDLSWPIAKHLPDEWVCVFIPMSLNPTAGFNIIVPKRDIIPIDISSEGVLQYIITAGAVMPHGDEAANY